MNSDESLSRDQLAQMNVAINPTLKQVGLFITLIIVINDSKPILQ